jgi:hypothetical protein
MGDEAFFLLGDGCFFGNPLDLVAMLATLTMMVRRAEAAKMGMMIFSKEEL